MLAIFKKGLVEAPQELNSAASSGSSSSPKLPQEILQDFLSTSACPNNNNCHPLSIGFADQAVIAYVPPQPSYSLHHRWFCGLDDIYCVFLGGLNNLCALLKQYGLSKNANEAMFAVEAYRALRDRGPCPAHQVLKDLDGSFGFVVYDSKNGTVFAALGADEKVKLFWGMAADGSMVISDDLRVIKASCAKSYAPFPAGCMFHSDGGLVSFEHPKRRMKAMPRIDSEGVMCGANFKVDSCTGTSGSMPRVGSEANWEVWGPHA